MTAHNTDVSESHRITIQSRVFKFRAGPQCAEFKSIYMTRLSSGWCDCPVNCQLSKQPWRSQEAARTSCSTMSATSRVMKGASSKAVWSGEPGQYHHGLQRAIRSRAGHSSSSRKAYGVGTKRPKITSKNLRDSGITVGAVRLLKSILGTFKSPTQTGDWLSALNNQEPNVQPGPELASETRKPNRAITNTCNTVGRHSKSRGSELM